MAKPIPKGGKGTNQHGIRGVSIQVQRDAERSATHAATAAESAAVGVSGLAAEEEMINGRPRSYYERRDSVSRKLFDKSVEGKDKVGAVTEYVEGRIAEELGAVAEVNITSWEESGYNGGSISFPTVTVVQRFSGKAKVGDVELDVYASASKTYEHFLGSNYDSYDLRVGCYHTGASRFSRQKKVDTPKKLQKLLRKADRRKKSET